MIKAAVPMLASSIALSALTVVRWRSAVPEAGVQESTIAQLRAAGKEPNSEIIDTATGTIIDNEPFRLSNTPPTTRFNVSMEAGVSGVAAPPPPRPVLVLKAIVGGPPWQAVVDGIPGQPAGTLVQQGNRFDRLLVKSVTRDSVVVQGADTAWVLRFRGR